MFGMKVALVQTALVWENPAANRDLLAERLRGSLNGDEDLVVLPEMFSTGFSMASARLAEPMDGATVGWLAAMARELDSTICGSVIIEVGGRYYNRLVWTAADGVHRTYDKRHLFRMANEHDHYAAGTSRLLVETGGFKVCPLVCYDLRFPVWSRSDGDLGVLIFVANWPAPRREQWLALLRARAIENQCYVIGVNRVGSDGNGNKYAGDSVVLDYRGDGVLDLGDQDTVGFADLDAAAWRAFRADFPAYLDADSFNLT
jgi:omega-amidase